MRIDTPEFRRWFGASKVVDEQGEPLVVYHGTDRDFSEFRAHSKSVNTTTFAVVEVERAGIFLSDNPTFSGQFGRRVMALYASIENPAVLTRDLVLDFAESIDPFGPDHGLYLSAKNTPSSWQLFDGELGRRFVAFLRDRGHDGAAFGEELETDDGYVEGRTFVAFDPRQIKSATDNVGTFDPENPDMRRNPSGALYHGSNDDDLEELDGNDPGYTGSLGWGLYLTTDPDFAKIFGKHIYEVESPVPDELVVDIEPDSYDCGNDLTFYTPGSTPFTFEIVDRKTRKTHRYSVLGDCDEQVREGLRKWALEGFAPSQELNDAGRALPQAAAKHVAQAARAVLKAASEDARVDDTIDGLIEDMAEAGVDDAILDDQVRPLLEALAEEIEKVADEKIAERLGDEIDLSDLSATVSEHGYSAFFISGYAPGDEYVIVDTEYLPIPVTK